MDASSPLISIIVPVYNEEKTVAAVITRLLSIDLPAPREIIVVNDGSRDNTAAVLDALEPSPLVTILHADRNRGKGHAIRLGFSRARGTVFAIQDADLELDPAQLADLVAPILRGEAAVIYGSRFLTGNSPTPWLSRVANAALTSFTNVLHGSSLTDMETCYKIMRGDVARSLDLTADRFDIEPEITAKLLLGGHEIVERPVTFAPRSRAAGKKIGWRDGVVAVKVLYRMRPPGALLTRALMLLALFTSIIALTVLIGGGFAFHVGGLLVRSHNPLIPCAIALAVIALVLARGRAQVSSASRWWWTTIGKLAGPLACLICVLTILTGWLAGTHVAGGSDSYRYLNQAEMFARGDLREAVPLAAKAPWNEATWSFTPTGHEPVRSGDAAIVPICAAGYPMIMAAARRVGGRPAMFWIVPLLGGLAVWMTFLLGRAIGGAASGLMASMMLASSPAFLYQVVQPMSDVPAAAMWSAALVIAWRARRAGSAAIRSSCLAGIVSGIAVTIRPNLIPLAGVVALGLAIAERDRRAGWSLAIRESTERLVAFGVGILPGVAAVMAIQNAMYGHPLASGYGDISALFRLDHIGPNLRRYPVWLLQTETPIVLLALAAPFVPPTKAWRRGTWWLLAFAAATLACYLSYAVFDAWWYLRFLLPALPPLLALTAAVTVGVLGRLPATWKAPAFALACGVIAIVYVEGAVEGYAFGLRDFEARFREAGEYVAGNLPSNAAVITVHQSGSVRFYSARPTMVWGLLPEKGLDAGVAYLRTQGYRPYLLFEMWEEVGFRERFARYSRIGGLEWPPIAEINRIVRIYDVADYERYMQGGAVSTARVWTRPRKP